MKDGHAPGLRGHDLNAYLAPGIGSDHESTGYDEGLEKLRRGMYLMIREGSSERNLEELLPLVTENTYHRCMLVTDDRNAKDLLYDGGVDALVRKAVRLGLDPVRAFQLATIVPATYFRLNGLGAIASGYWANLLVLSDLSNPSIESVYYRGRLVAHDARPLFDVPPNAVASGLSSMSVKTFAVDDLKLARTGDTTPVMEVIPGQITTRWLEERSPMTGATLVSDPERDLVKVVVVERHKATGNIGKGLVKGLGLKHGALATSFAHDSHNIVAVGVNDEDIYAAIKSIESMGGGLVAIDQGAVCASLALPIAGLMTDQSLEQVVGLLEELELAARRMGCCIPSPFSVLSFLALPVIPELKITDLGLVDVVRGRLVGGEA
jgi:adenine deaminase